MGEEEGCLGRVGGNGRKKFASELRAEKRRRDIGDPRVRGQLLLTPSRIHVAALAAEVSPRQLPPGYSERNIYMIFGRGYLKPV